jgi:hypothetical protein
MTFPDTGPCANVLHTDTRREQSMLLILEIEHNNGNVVGISSRFIYEQNYI